MLSTSDRESYDTRLVSVKQKNKKPKNQKQKQNCSPWWFRKVLDTKMTQLFSNTYETFK